MKGSPMKKMVWLLLCILAVSIVFADAPPRRIVSLAPNITEIIYRIGAGELLVGRTEFCLYPPAVQRIPTVGGYLNVDYEKIISLQPDLILMLPNPDMERKLQMLNLRIFTVGNETLNDILQGIRAIGRVLNRYEQAAQLVQGIQDTLRRISENQRADSSFSTLIVVGRQPGSLKGVYAAGKETYLSELVELCGGVNAFRDVPLRYFEVSKEDLIERDPQVILEFHVTDAGENGSIEKAYVNDWQALPALSAVRRRRIFIFTDRYFLIPGPRVSRAAMTLYHLFQKELHD